MRLSTTHFHPLVSREKSSRLANVTDDRTEVQLPDFDFARFIVHSRCVIPNVGVQGIDAAAVGRLSRLQYSRWYLGRSGPQSAAAGASSGENFKTRTNCCT